MLVDLLLAACLSLCHTSPLSQVFRLRWNDIIWTFRPMYLCKTDYWFFVRSDKGLLHYCAFYNCHMYSNLTATFLPDTHLCIHNVQYCAINLTNIRKTRLLISAKLCALELNSCSNTSWRHADFLLVHSTNRKTRVDFGPEGYTGTHTDHTHAETHT